MQQPLTLSPDTATPSVRGTTAGFRDLRACGPAGRRDGRGAAVEARGIVSAVTGSSSARLLVGIDTDFIR